MLTAYDYPTAKLVDEAGIPLILVGDSLGRVMLGYENEIPVSMADMLHHTAAVTRGAKHALVIGDMPFLSYATPEEARRTTPVASSRRPAPRPSRSRAASAARGSIEALVKAGIPVHGPHRLDPAGGERRGQGPGPRQEPRTGPDAPRRRARRPGGGRLLDRPRARAGAAGRGDHGAARGSRRSASAPAPGCSGQVQVITDLLGLGQLAPDARAARTRTCARRSSTPSGRTRRTSRRARSPARRRPCAWTTRCSTRCSAARRLDLPGGTDPAPAGIPLDRDL